jgi:hypothetical protein
MTPHWASEFRALFAFAIAVVPWLGACGQRSPAAPATAEGRGAQRASLPVDLPCLKELDAEETEAELDLRGAGPALEIALCMPPPDRPKRVSPQIDLGKVSMAKVTIAGSYPPPPQWTGVDVSPRALPEDAVRPPSGLEPAWHELHSVRARRLEALRRHTRASELLARCGNESCDRACLAYVESLANAQAQELGRDAERLERTLVSELARPAEGGSADALLMLAALREEAARRSVLQDSDVYDQLLGAAKRAYEVASARAAPDSSVGFWARYGLLRVALGTPEDGSAKRAANEILSQAPDELHVDVRFLLAVAAQARHDPDATRAFRVIAESATKPEWRRARVLTDMSRLPWAQGACDGARYREAIEAAAPLCGWGDIGSEAESLIAFALFRMARSEQRAIARVPQASFARIAMELGERAAAHLDLERAAFAWRAISEHAPQTSEAPRALQGLASIRGLQGASVGDVRDQATHLLGLLLGACAGNGAHALSLEIDATGMVKTKVETRVEPVVKSAQVRPFHSCLEEEGPSFYRGFGHRVRARLEP